MKSWMRLTGVFLVWGLSYGIGLGLISSAYAETQQVELWQNLIDPQLEVQSRSLSESDNSTIHSYENAQLMRLNVDLMRSNLGLNNPALGIQAKGSQVSEQYEISMPLPDGRIIDLILVKDSILPEQLAAKYPDINTYRVLASDMVFSGKVDISDVGFHAMLQMLDGEIVFIDPVELSESQYAVFNKSAQKLDSHRQSSYGIESVQIGGDFDIQSLLKSANIAAREIHQEGAGELSARTQDSLKNYTIAVATTGEYSAKFGGSVGGTLAAITTTISRVNQVLERDLGIHLNLVENNDLLINTDNNSDPFNETRLLDLVFQNQDFIDSVIGNSNYDIGHLFTDTGGGLAAIASACNSSDKAKAASGITSPRGDSFDLDFVAHEIGHQLGATHTFNSSQGACSTETRTARTAFEPGSGSSIMSYAGTCGLDNIQPNTDAMYHIGSIKQIAEYTNTGVGSRCGVNTPSQNTAPIVDAGKDYTIPARTPFELMGNASDNDGDSLLYAWEQSDAGDTSTESSDRGNNALFRVHTPNSSKSRSFPPLANVISHTSARGETLPEYQRSLTMNFVAQDGFNVSQSDEMRIQVARTGSRFALNFPRAFYNRGSTYPVFWNVANTDKSPVNCSTVDIWLSLDGGQNFDRSIASNVLNNGETQITIPADVFTTPNGRFKIKCSDNIFYAVSFRNFRILDNDDTDTFQFPDEDQPEANLRDVSLNSNSGSSSSSVNATVATSSNNSGGGIFDIASYLLFLLFIKGFYLNRNCRKRYK